MYFCWSGDRPRSQNPGPAGPGGDALLQAASGERHSLLLLSNGAVQSCGDNSHGQLGRKGVQRGERPGERRDAGAGRGVRQVAGLGDLGPPGHRSRENGAPRSQSATHQFRFPEEPRVCFGF